METEFVIINNTPAQVASIGGCLPSEILENPSKKPEEMILIIPGNPGVIKFYEIFMTRLHEKTKLPIWLVSHGGHDKFKMKYPKLKRNKNLYNLNGQSKQKKALIETYLKGVKLYFVGHSIGCKMILDILGESDDTQNIAKCFLLFPTIERMAETRNGKIVLFVINYILWLTIFGAWLFVRLPKFLRLTLLRMYCLVTGLAHHNIPALLQLVDPHVLNKVFFLADDEMTHVRDLDEKPFKKHADKLKLYYGASDTWTPLNYYEELKIKYPKVDAEVCSKGYQHAFVLTTPIEVANLVAEWMT